MFNKILCFRRFHTVTEDGNPWLDMSHIVMTLNKLDAGTMEKVIEFKALLNHFITQKIFPSISGTINE